MACKISDTATPAHSFVWPSVSPGRSTLSLRLAPGSSSRATEVYEAEESNGEQSKNLEQIRQAELAQCRATAFEEGLRKGREELAGDLKAANDRLAQVLRDLATVKRRARNDAESEMVRLSLAIAKRVLHREMSCDPESIEGVVHAALQKLGSREIVSVRVCPAAVDPVRRALEKASATPAISIISDAKLRVGDIVFETSLGELDASIDTQLKEIERGFADRLGF